MPEQGNSRRQLSEISHLFLSSVRERQTGGVAAPRRKPPTASVSVDLTPEEYHQVAEEPVREEPMRVPPVKAVIASHLGVRQLEYLRRYARHMAGLGWHVGLMVVDAGEFRLVRYDPHSGEEAGEVPQSGCFDARAITDSINELNCDLDQWLVAIANPRVPEGRALLGQIRHWVALGTCDHEGVVACYRSLKGLSDLHAGVEKLTFATLDAQDGDEAEGVYRKLAGVCEQFLGRKVESDGAVNEVEDVGEAVVINCVVEHDKAQLAGAAHWQVVSDFLQAARQCPLEADANEEKSVPEGDAEMPTMAAAMKAREVQQQDGVGAEKVQATVMFAGQPKNEREAGADMAEVIDLPMGQESHESVLAAVMQHSLGEMIECPVRPPMCSEARLVVGRDKRLMLLAVARSGLTDLKSIGQAYRWMVENRGLLAMALPQFSLDAHQLPHLRLLVDQADIDAEVLQGVFAAETVQVQTYRRVKWGERKGLLLEAA
ncbi:MAG TPA: hypothetical protein VHP11_07730 [Tepidisphaeraceae bacterium]|nr:hypothetical protein [Tepidisphaeraceae bacterium]